MQNFLLVALGGALGASLRYGASLLALSQFGARFPLGTLLINLLGCILIGILSGVLPKKSPPSEWSLFLITGVLGGFTTFSAFGLETLHLLREGRMAGAAVYVLGSVLGGIFLVFLGWKLAAIFHKTGF